MSCGLQRATGADLGRLLAEQAGPQSELALTLEGVSLGIEAADEDEVAVEAPQVVRRQVRDVLVVVGMGETLALGGQQLDHVRATVADRRGRLVQLGDYFVAHWALLHRSGVPAFWSGRKRGSPARRLGHTGPPRVTAEPEGPLNRNLPEAAGNLTMRTGRCLPASRALAGPPAPVECAVRAGSPPGRVCSTRRLPAPVECAVRAGSPPRSSVQYAPPPAPVECAVRAPATGLPLRGKRLLHASNEH